MESVWCGRHHQPPAQALCTAHRRTSSRPPCTSSTSVKIWPFPCRMEASPCAACLQQKGDRSSPGSDRPVALLCSVSKVFETLVNDQVLSFCLANRVLPDCQFGFLPGRSAVWQLLSVLDDWHAAREKGTSVKATFFDLAKARPLIELTTNANKKTGFFWSKPNLCWLVQKLLVRTNNCDHGGSCWLVTPVHF